MLCPERTAAPTVNVGFANKEAQSALTKIPVAFFLSLHPLFIVLLAVAAFPHDLPEARVLHNYSFLFG